MIMVPSLYICSPNISLPLNKSSQRLHLQGKQVLQDRVGSKDISSELSHPILKKRPNPKNMYAWINSLYMLSGIDIRDTQTKKVSVHADFPKWLETY